MNPDSNTSKFNPLIRIISSAISNMFGHHSSLKIDTFQWWLNEILSESHCIKIFQALKNVNYIFDWSSTLFHGNTVIYRSDLLNIVGSSLTFFFKISILQCVNEKKRMIFQQLMQWKFFMINSTLLDISQIFIMDFPAFPIINL